MPSSGVVARILAFNHGRRPDMLALKYAKLAKSPFSFFRGTGHLFYEAGPLPPALAGAPLAGLCGDLHLENFGAYLGDNGLAYFSVNDFDDALLGPVAWDLARFCASLFVGLASLGRPASAAQSLAEDFLHAYAEALLSAAAPLPDEAVLNGPIGAILRAFPTTAALDPYSGLLSSPRQLNPSHKAFLPASPAERADITQRLSEFARREPSAGVHAVLDMVRLLEGTSSLGLARYAVLTEGQGVLELKEVQGSCAAPYLNCRQPGWPSDAARVVAAQRRFQAVPPALLGAVGDASSSFIVRAYAGAHARLDLSDPSLTGPALAATLRPLARLAAAGHRSGAADPQSLPAFARSAAVWQPALVSFAQSRAAQSQSDYQEYSAAYAQGDLNNP